MIPQVHVVATGGTIASTPDEDGAAPSMDGEELLVSVPDLASYADLSVESVSQVPGFDVDFEIMAEVAERAREAAADGADAVVVTHGTDTMAETAYFLDLTCSLSVPVVVTGAQRRLDEPSSDAPANLLAAARGAAHSRVGEGVFLAFDDELHAARDVRKVHSHKLAAFASPNDGPVATLTRDEIRFHREPQSESVYLPVARSDANVTAPDTRVEMVVSAAGVDGRQVEHAVESGADGLVLAGTGLGNATSDLGEAVADAIDAGVPVVLTSRTGAGTTGAVYGTAGGGQTLQDRGAIPGGDLAPWKARVKLALALDAIENPEEAAQYFADSATSVRD
ncbi:asparaginase [Halorussus gelatinilyticus]|uniref:L-asparaginase n=1 Tax=Halorussus gelatinilyticus TaxID=2937524 RepID=A0A8U0IFN3_9EURY|nr:asparaginase [Halorussus gelatinilyticus]UPV99792.1 asparaginase [Halorussus gelatinilyticus]